MFMRSKSECWKTSKVKRTKLISIYHKSLVLLRKTSTQNWTHNICLVQSNVQKCVKISQQKSIFTKFSQNWTPHICLVQLNVLKMCEDISTKVFLHLILLMTWLGMKSHECIPCLVLVKSKKKDHQIRQLLSKNTKKFQDFIWC